MNVRALLPYLLLPAIGLAVYQFAWLPGSARRTQLNAEKTRLQTELAAQEQLLGQRAAVQEMELKWQAQRQELAMRLPPVSYWPEMLARVESLFFRPGLDVASFRVTSPIPLVTPAPAGQEGTPPGVSQGGAVAAPQPGDLLIASGEAAVTANSKEAFFSLLAGLEALDFLVPVNSVSYTLTEGEVQGRVEFSFLLSRE